MDSSALVQQAVHSKESDEEMATDNDFSVFKLRQTLNKSLINMLSELDKAVGSSPSTSVLSNFFKFIECFRYCLEGFPQIFVSCDASADSHTTSAFTEWTLMRLLHVLNQSYPSVVHDGCIDLFVSLLQVVRTSSPISFRRFALQLLHLLSDLTAWNKSWHENPPADLIIKQYFASENGATLEIDDNLDLTDCPFVISTLNNGSCFQEKILNLIQKLGSDLFLFLPDHSVDIWKLLCNVLESGNFALKEAALNTVKDFVEQIGLPNSNFEINYILDCLQALVTLCANCKMELISIPSSLRTSLASCLTCISVTLYENIDSDIIHDFTLCRIVENLLLTITQHGLKDLRMDNLHIAIMQAILELLKCLKFNGTMPSESTMKTFSSTLCENLNSEDSKEVLSPVLVYLILHEAYEAAASKSPTHRLSFVQSPSFQSVITTNGNDSSLPIYRKINIRSATSMCLSETLLSTLKDDLEIPGSSHIHSISASLYVILHSSISFSLGNLVEHFIPVSIDQCPDSLHYLLPPDSIALLLQYAAKLCSTSPNQVPHFGKIIDICNCLLFAQDQLPLASSDYNNLAVLLSFPFTLNLNVNLGDLVSPMNALSPNIPIEMQEKCLEGLSRLPTHIAKEWRLYVLHIFIDSKEEALKLKALQMIPLFYYYGVCRKHNVEDSLKKYLKENNVSVLREVVKTLGKLNCIIHSCCIICRCKNDSGLLDFIPEIMCKVCNLDCNSDVSDEIECLSWLSPMFIQVLEHENADVRLECSLILKSFLRHGKLGKSLLSSILKLLVDPQLEIRRNLCFSSQYILKPMNTRKIGWNLDMEEVLISTLKYALQHAKNNDNICMRETVLNTIGELGKHADQGILLICIISLLENVLSSEPLVVAVARLNVREIAIFKHYKMADLFRIYIEPICKFLVESLLSCCSEDVENALPILEKMCSIFGYPNLKPFLSIAQKHIIPYLVRQESRITSPLIKLLSQLLETNKRDLLMNNFPFIFSHLVCHCNKDEMETALTYVQKETDLGFGNLLRCNYQHIHNELLLNISSHYEQVFSGLATLALKNEHLSNQVLTNREEMADYLQPKLLGFLVFFDSQLLKSSVTLDTKKLALKSLISIMKLMGPRHITTVRFKVMATLRIALRFKEDDFPKICCEAWNAFIRSIDVLSLGPLLNQVVVILLPLLETEPVAVSEILFYLIMENQNSLKEFFHELYFIPDVPQLKEIHAVLKDYIQDPSSQSDFQTVLRHSLKGVSHENLEIRLFALEKLKKVLYVNQVALHEHMLDRESVDHLLSYLISVVMPCCRESDVRARALLGECLGGLGAIDPGRLEVKSVTSKEAGNDFLSSVESDHFAIILIQKLAHSFLAATDCRVQDCSAFAIQEALRIYKCSNPTIPATSRNSRDYQLWQSFSPEIQEILDVLSHSQYKPLDKSKQTYPRPIYKSSLGSSFNDWVTNWYNRLLQCIKRDIPAKVFQSCSIIMKYDLNCALFLLPHIVVCALMDCSNGDRREIVEETLAVLTDGQNFPLSSDFCRLSCQTIFSVFDHMMKWCVWKQQLIASDKNSKSSAAIRVSREAGFMEVNDFMSKIPQILLAKASFSCHAYTRALMYLEQHLANNPSELESNISFLQELYSCLDEPDGVAGVVATRTEEPKLKDAILEHEATGDMQAAFACYEKAISLFPDEVSYYGGLLKCFIRMDQPSTALTYCNGILNQRPQWEDQLNAYRVEATWKLASWDSLNTYLENEPQSDKWNVGVGKLFFYANEENVHCFNDQIKIVRCSQMAPLCAASMENGAYLRGYEHLTKLHMLTDIEQSSVLLFTKRQDLKISTLNNVLAKWKLRRDSVQSSMLYNEPILGLHRVLLNMCKTKQPGLNVKFDQEIASCWLESAKLARKSGHHQRAYSCLLEASATNIPAVFIQKSKWHWNKGENEQATTCLKKGIEEHFSNISNVQTDGVRSIKQQCAKAKLLLATYSEESATTDSTRLIQMYSEIVSMQPQWEESHYHLAKYYDKMLAATDNHDNKLNIMVHVARSFAASLKYGCKHVYHSLPRLLDIWFDLGTQVAEGDTATRKSPAFKIMEASLNDLTRIIADLSERLPLFLFMTAFPQLISRICHSHSEVFSQLQKLLVKLLATYSQQSIWMMIAVSKSSYQTRVQRCKKIFQAAIAQKPELTKFIQDTTKLADKLIELSNKNVTESNTFNLTEYFPSLLKMVEDSNFSKIMIPLQSQMMVTLPSGHASNAQHNPFPFNPICIQGFRDTAEVFVSLQRPKKLIIKGSDGKEYGIICKAKDDLRKDCRLIEFNNLVNRYLKSDPEARKRQLYIRTYGVIPLNEDCGLIEWVPNLAGLRLILQKIYKYKGLLVSNRELTALQPHRTATVEQKLHNFRTKILPKFPSVFYEWFLSTFPDPTSWYLARLAYARTTSVMSMVGYIVGLGDRHGENILLDSSCGDIVHVDLSCLFNKGETMDCPERVPFRLTHNMVHAMGPTIYEGVFRKACEVTMRVMRSQTDALMSVLRPFVHDPLVEWSRSSRQGRAPPLVSGEIRNELGLTHVKDIELRLNGIIKSKNKSQGLPLSIEGQVNYLIQDATDETNLAQMYIGWSAQL